MPPTRSRSEFCEAVRSCLGARLEAVQKFSLNIKNKIGGELLGSVLAAARACWSCALKQFGVAWERVSKRFRNLVSAGSCSAVFWQLLGSLLGALKQFGVAWERVSKRFRNLVFI